MDINVTIKCPDLPLAAAVFAKAILGHAEKTEEDIGRDKEGAACDMPPTAVTPVQPPVSPTTASTPAMTTPPVATTAPTSVPTTPAPQITGDMVAKAGADLIAVNPAAMGPLNALLQKYGVGCAQELRPDQIGPFATEMRALGAKI